jgi:flagellar hook-associated protein 3 FlgL
MGVSMRITTSYLYSSALRGLRRNQAQLDRAQVELASGRKIIIASDNPTDSVTATRLASHIEDIAQYQRNGLMASTRLETEGAAMEAVADLLEQAQEIAKGTSSLDPDDPGRQAAATAIAELRLQVISIANTKVGDEYLFGGTRSGTPPFDENGLYQGSNDSRSVEVDEGVYLATNVPGDPVFTGLIESMGSLNLAISSGDSGGITRATGGLEAAAQTLERARTENGLRQTRLDSIATTLAQRAVGMGDRRDTLLNADPTAAALEAVAAQSALERAYAAVAKVLETSILQYLR